MSDSDAIAQETIDLTHAVGECVLAWSKVEFQLSLLFALVLNTSIAVSHATFAAVRSFEARLKMMNDALCARFVIPEEPPRPDWKLIHNECSRLNALRNQVAHSHLLRGPILEPYFVLTASKPRLKVEDVRSRTREFLEFEPCVMWLHNDIIPRLRPEKVPDEPIPRLLLRLRDEAAQRRAKHGRPPRS